MKPDGIYDVRICHLIPVLCQIRANLGVKQMWRLLLCLCYGKSIFLTAFQKLFIVITFRAVVQQPCKPQLFHRHTIAHCQIGRRFHYPDRMAITPRLKTMVQIRADCLNIRIIPCLVQSMTADILFHCPRHEIDNRFPLPHRFPQIRRGNRHIFGLKQIDICVETASDHFRSLFHIR